MLFIERNKRLSESADYEMQDGCGLTELQPDSAHLVAVGDMASFLVKRAWKASYPFIEEDRIKCFVGPEGIVNFFLQFLI